MVYVIATNGDKGCSAQFCMNWTSEHIAYQRQQEAINAAAVLGVKAADVVLLVTTVLYSFLFSMFFLFYYLSFVSFVSCI